MREPNVTTHSLENQEHGTSSSHVEPTNRAAPPPQTSEEAYASQHQHIIAQNKTCNSCNSCQHSYATNWNQQNKLHNQIITKILIT